MDERSSESSITSRRRASRIAATGRRNAPHAPRVEGTGPAWHQDLRSSLLRVPCWMQQRGHTGSARSTHSQERDGLGGDHGNPIQKAKGASEHSAPHEPWAFVTCHPSQRSLEARDLLRSRRLPRAPASRKSVRVARRGVRRSRSRYGPRLRFRGDGWERSSVVAASRFHCSQWTSRHLSGRELGPHRDAPHGSHL